MEITQITETLYAIPVPTEAHSFTAHNAESNYRGKTNYLSEIWCRKDNYSERIYSIDDNVDIKIIGTVTQEEIDFDCEPHVKPSIDLPEYKYGGEIHPKETYWDYESKTFWMDCSDDSFRSLLSSKGIKPTKETKLLIIEKV